MNSSITKLVLTRNNRDQIEKTLKSLKGPILVGDMESSDDTVCICSKYAKIIKLPWTKSYADGWNKLISHVDGVVFILNPGEVLIYEEELEGDEVYGVTTVAGDWINYSTRIWHTDRKIKFKNRVFEETDASYTKKISTTICLSPGRKSAEVSELMSLWEREDVKSASLSYYKAIFRLSVGDLNGFKSCAHEYLFRSSKVTDSTVLIWLYLGFAEMTMGNMVKSTEWAACVLGERPWLAEAWCMAAEAAAKLNQPARASALYKMAVAAGKHRPDSDRLPIDIGKYRDQPNEYIKAFETALLTLPGNTNNNRNIAAEPSQ